MNWIKLFVKPNCAYCPQAIKLCDQVHVAKEIKIEKYDVSTDIGLAEAAFYEVMATPSILVINDDECEIESWRGEVPDLDRLNEALSE